MRSLFTLTMLFLVLPSFAQDSSQIKFKGLEVNYGMNTLRGQIYNFFELQNISQDPQFGYLSDTFNFSYLNPHIVNRWTFNAEGTFNLSGKTNQELSLGILYDGSLNQYSYYSENETFLIDTVYVSSNETGQTDTLIQDSTSYDFMYQRYYTENIGVYGTYLWALNNSKRHRLQTGISLGFGMSISQSLVTSYGYGWSSDLTIDGEVDKYAVVIPSFNPVQGTSGSISTYSNIGDTVFYTRVNKSFYIQPTIPFKISTALAKKGILSQIDLVMTAQAGIRAEIVRNGGIQARFLYGWRGGLAYRF